MKKYFFACALLLIGCLAASAHSSAFLNSEDNLEVSFYASYGYDAGDTWQIPIYVWVSKPPNAIRRLTARTARKALTESANIEQLSDAQKALFKIRVKGFISNSKSDQVISILIPGDPIEQPITLQDTDGLKKTDRNGLLEATLTIDKNRAQSILSAQASKDGWIRFHAVSENHTGSGRFRLVPSVGVSVISDIDDTVKDTGITKGHELVIRNTFFEPFKQTPCMAQFYQSAKNDVAFHYVSGAPWQLYTPIAHFLFAEEDAYPAGSVHMKSVRTNLTESESYQDIWKLISGGSEQTTFEQKVQQISDLIAHFPVRQFILIGDSGERDPEVFTEIRNRYPAHISRIIIRDVNDTQRNNPQRLTNMQVINGADSLTNNTSSICNPALTPASWLDHN